MGHKSDNLAHSTIEAVLLNVGFKRFVELFEAVVEDCGALHADMESIGENREAQFRAGIRKMLKARKGVEKDNAPRYEECDCVMNERCPKCASPDEFQSGCKKGKTEKNKKQKKAKHLLMERMNLSRSTVGDLLSAWTGTSIKLIGKKTDVLPFYEDDVKRMMQRCECVEDLHTGLSEMFGCGVTVKSADGAKLDGSAEMNTSDKRYVLALD